MLTSTRWWPYPILLVCGLSFVYGTFVYKFKILHTTNMNSETLVEELAFLISFRKLLKTASPAEAWKICDVQCASSEEVIHVPTQM